VTSVPKRPPWLTRGRARLAAWAAALLVAAGAAPATLRAGDVHAASGGATASGFDGQGMWIWYVSRSHGGSVSRIIARARQSGVGSVYIKAGDAARPWSQFSSSLVSALHAGGLRVCAWQFVYGDNPRAEARVGAAAVAKGADCLIIDAEGHYEGKYASADRYIRALRERIGPDFPLSLAGFPYVDYHPAFPYSVFLGPDGAQYSQPQMYWKTIGTSVRGVFAHTYTYNRPYKRPIYPIGQTYLDPARREIRKFRRTALSYGAPGVSWWSWQETSRREWRALGRRVRRLRGFQPAATLPVLDRGSRGDLVVWAQQHLIAAGQTQLPATGIFGGGTVAAVSAFQAQNGLPADGEIGATTWRVLLNHAPVRIAWGARRGVRRGLAVSARPGGGSAPLSAELPARRDEIAPGPQP
jgi:Putative peptidoglycan binding domain